MIKDVSLFRKITVQCHSLWFLKRTERHSPKQSVWDVTGFLFGQTLGKCIIWQLSTVLSPHLHCSPLPGQHCEVLWWWSYIHCKCSVHSRCSVKALWVNDLSDWRQNVKNVQFVVLRSCRLNFKGDCTFACLEFYIGLRIKHLLNKGLLTFTDFKCLNDWGIMIVASLKSFIFLLWTG